ncbi:MAG TPA: hypothetical protein VHP56_05630 [Solirubrobacterales bacterium]|jgi:hypothetical protein|nr:hypothetical protein [Solirubrobacterales bacterium]
MALDRRVLRKRGVLVSGGGELAEARARADAATVRRLRRINAVAATAFVIGGSLFSLGALLAQAHVGGPRLAAAVFMVGGVFFTTGGYASVLQVANAPREVDGVVQASAWRWWSTEPGRLDWGSAVALFVGTLYFGASLLVALLGDLTTAQLHRDVWTPEIIGCVLFLVSGHLALTEMHRDRPPGARADLGWWIVVVNQVGSALFMAAGIAAFVRPETGDALAVGIANWSTFAGAACFAAAGVMQEFERP